MNVEITQIVLTCGAPFSEAAETLTDARAVRGFFGRLYRHRPEFHGHRGDELIYRHPLIQYKIVNETAVIIGLKEGAYLIKAVPKIEHLEIYHRKYKVIEQKANTEIISFGLIKNMVRYCFKSPWIGLNGENHEKYDKLYMKEENTNVFLEKILTGNLLSVSKAVGYVASERIIVKTRLKENGMVEVKPGLKLKSFTGTFDANFLIPNLWGIGKFSSRGYGVVKALNGCDTQCQNK